MVNGVLTPPPILNEAPQAKTPANMCKKAWMKNDHRKRPRSNSKLISRGKELWRRSLPKDAPLHHFARQQTCWSGLRVRFCVPRLSRRIHIVFIMQPSACGLSHHMVKCGVASNKRNGYRMNLKSVCILCWPVLAPYWLKYMQKLEISSLFQINIV